MPRLSHGRATALAVALSLVLAPPVLAQATTDPAPLASAPSGPAPATSRAFRSAFADYKPWRDIERGGWRQLNDALRPTAGTTPEAGGQDRHGMHGMHGMHGPQGPGEQKAAQPPGDSR